MEMEMEIERFLNKVRKTKDNSCWEWCGAISSTGYGNFTINGKTVGAHRVSYKMTFGDIPTGLFVLHKCDNPRCVNPSHLFLGTHTDNMNDMAMKGRRAQTIFQFEIRRGESCGRAILKDEQVIHVLQLPILTKQMAKSLSEKFGVSVGTIKKIREKNGNWKHLRHHSISTQDRVNRLLGS